MEPDSAVYRALVESTQAIPWRIDWSRQVFTFIGPQIEELLGWSQRSWRSVQDWADRIHPEDRERVVQFCIAQSTEGVDHEADYRALRQDGSYVWIRDVVHVERKGGRIEALVGFMFDISERKEQEEALLCAKRELERLSFEDELTRIPNRRMFDATFAREWQQARETGSSVSLIFVDVDRFKSYNDRLGHLAGDDCLQRVAGLLAAALQESRNLLCRYGGEEFVVLLPGAGIEAARTLAEHCRSVVQGAGLPHPDPESGGCVTVSAGVAAIVPGAADDPRSFLNEADSRLYKAKRDGRNRVEG